MLDLLLNWLTLFSVVESAVHIPRLPRLVPSSPSEPKLSAGAFANVSSPDVEVSEVNGLGVAHDGWVFTIQIHDSPQSCLNVPGDSGYQGALLNIWECNGHEGQLWYFDDGSYQIRWAGDSNLCIDAGDFTQGNQLMLWECYDGSYNQRWSYDGTIYLAIDNPLCMDVYGGNMDWGTPIILWECLHIWSQTWMISSGITIRTGANYQVCLDLAGGDTTPGTAIQLWQCNGLDNQKWIFADGENVIKSAKDPSKCIDGGDLSNGFGLMLWDCNSYPSQNWGWDGTIYTDNGRGGVACFDLPGGSLEWGSHVGLWDCNHCWNQYFDIAGPISLLLLGNNTLDASDDCPGTPTPGPSPGPSPFVIDHCHYGENGWYKFDDESALRANSAWAGYITDVYGGVPSWGYPICVGSFWFLYKDKVEWWKLSDQGIRACPDHEGAWFEKWVAFQKQGFSFIFHSGPYKAVPGNHWVEITHTTDWVATNEKHGAWFFHTPGSGIWFWTGNTLVFQDHQEGALLMCGHTINELSSTDFDQLGKCAMKLGVVDSVQFINRRDPQWSCGSPAGIPRKGFQDFKNPQGIEIIGIKSGSMFLEGNFPCANKHGTGVFKAGWEASEDCICDTNADRANCHISPGYPPIGTGHRSVSNDESSAPRVV